VAEPTPLVAHRCLVWAGRADGNTYEISRYVNREDLDEVERAMRMTWTPVEARRLATYLTGMGWHDVGIERIALANISDGSRQLAAMHDEEGRPQMRFAAAGDLTCRAVATARPPTVAR